MSPEPYTMTSKIPKEEQKLRGSSQALLDGILEADKTNRDFRHMELLIDTLWNAGSEKRDEIIKKIQSLYEKHKNLSDFAYEYVKYLLVYKEDYRAGLNLAKDIWDRDEKMHWKIKDEIFMEITVQIVQWKFQDYVLYGLKIFGNDIGVFIEQYRNASNDKKAIINYNRALRYIQKSTL